MIVTAQWTQPRSSEEAMGQAASRIVQLWPPRMVSTFQGAALSMQKGGSPKRAPLSQKK